MSFFFLHEERLKKILTYLGELKTSLKAFNIWLLKWPSCFKVLGGGLNCFQNRVVQISHVKIFNTAVWKMQECGSTRLLNLGLCIKCACSFVYVFPGWKLSGVYLELCRFEVEACRAVFTLSEACVCFQFGLYDPLVSASCLVNGSKIWKQIFSLNIQLVGNITISRSVRTTVIEGNLFLSS